MADTLGYRDRGSVHHIVQRALKGQEAQSVQQHRKAAYERLEALLVGFWECAQGGDLGAVRQALSIVMAEIKLLGVEEPSGTKDSSTNCGPRTVVVSPDDCRHGGCPTHGRFDDVI